MAQIIFTDQIGGPASTVRDALDNKAEGFCSTVFGGQRNEIISPLQSEATASTIIGGNRNLIDANNKVACFATILGGRSNTVIQSDAAIGGGCRNTIFNKTKPFGSASIIGGGFRNTIDGNFSSMGGGDRNNSFCESTYTTVFGGRNNNNYGTSSTIIGGWYNNNNISGCYSTVSGGYDNCNSAPYSFVGGGFGNTSSSNYGFIGGGTYNSTMQGDYSSIVGGKNNKTNSNSTTIIGGDKNKAMSRYSSIIGGCENYILGDCSTIFGGLSNLISDSNKSNIIGGFNNDITTSTGSTILGGIGNRVIDSLHSGIAGSDNVISSQTLGDCSSKFIFSTNSTSSKEWSAVLGGQNLNTIGDLSTHVPFLNINNLASGTSISNLGIDGNGFVTLGEDPNFLNLTAARGKSQPPNYNIISNSPTLANSNIFQGDIMLNNQIYDDWESSVFFDSYNPLTGIWTCPQTGLYNISYSVFLKQCIFISGNQPWGSNVGGKFIPKATFFICTGSGLGWGLTNNSLLTGFTCFCPTGYEPTPDGQACFKTDILPYTGSPGLPIGPCGNYTFSVSNLNPQTLFYSNCRKDVYGSFGLRIFKPDSWDQNGYPLSGAAPWVNSNEVNYNYSTYNNGALTGGTPTNPWWTHNFCTTNEGNYSAGCSYDYYVYCYGTTYTNDEGQVINYTNPCDSINDVWRRRLNNIGVWFQGNSYWPGSNDCTANTSIADCGYPGTLCLCDTFNVPTSKQYYIGLAGDNGITIEINGEMVVGEQITLDHTFQSNFKWWNIYPINLNAGPNNIYMCNTNVGAVGLFGAEIYDMTLAQLTGVTTIDDLNYIYSTYEYFPGQPREGQTSCPFNVCPEGYVYAETDEGPVCIKVEFTGCTSLVSNAILNPEYGMISAGITRPDNSKLYVGSHITPKEFTREAHLSGGQVNVLLNQGEELCLKVNNTTGIAYTPIGGNNKDYTAMTIQLVKDITPTPTPTPTTTPTPTPTITPTPTPTPSLPDDCNVEGDVFAPNIPTPTPTASPSIFQNSCIGLFPAVSQDMPFIDDVYLYFDGVVNGKPSFITDEPITLNDTFTCTGESIYQSLYVYWNSTSSVWVAESESGVTCAELSGSSDPNFPIATGTTLWTPISLSSDCPCGTFWSLINTTSFDSCAFRFSLAKSTTYSGIEELCGSETFYSSRLEFLFGYTPNNGNLELVDTIQNGVFWYEDKEFGASLEDGFYMINKIIDSEQNTRYWFEIQGKVVVNNGLC